MKKTAIFTLCAIFMFCTAAFGQLQVTITEECVYLDELTAPTIPHTKVACGVRPGETKNFSKEVIDNYLARAGIKAKVKNGAVVTRLGEKLSEQDIIKAAEDAYKKAFPDIEVVVEQVRMAKEIYAANASDFSIKIDTTKFGSCYAEVNNGIRKSQVYMYVKAYKNGYVASDRIKPGESLAGKIRAEKIDVTTARQNVLTNPEGLSAAKTITKGKTITEDLVQKLPSLAKGEAVRIVYDNGVIKIEASGVTEENAFIGKPVQVKNTASKKIITAVYMGGGIVKPY